MAPIELHVYRMNAIFPWNESDSVFICNKYYEIISSEAHTGGEIFNIPNFLFSSTLVHSPS